MRPAKIGGFFNAKQNLLLKTERMTMTRQMTGAKMIVQALKDQGVDTVFGYPGGAVLPIYDEIFQQNDIRHILVRHEQGAVHAAEGVCAFNGQTRRCFGDIWPRCNKRGYRPDRCPP